MTAYIFVRSDKTAVETHAYSFFSNPVHGVPVARVVGDLRQAGCSLFVYSISVSLSLSTFTVEMQKRGSVEIKGQKGDLPMALRSVLTALLQILLDPATPYPARLSMVEIIFGVLRVVIVCYLFSR